jgi:hypothetical protein
MRERAETYAMRFSARSILALLATASLAACATEQASAPAAKAVASAAPAPRDGPTADASVLGLYLAGSTAASQGRSDIAVDYLAKAAGMVDEGNQGFLKEQAFSAAVVSGRISDAVTLAPTEGQASIGSVRLGRLVVSPGVMARPPIRA